MNIAGNELPDRCPDTCPNQDSFYLHGQSAICGRCPVLCCVPDPDGFCLIEPADYRADWASAWADWFKGGMVGTPTLRLRREEEHG